MGERARFATTVLTPIPPPCPIPSSYLRATGTESLSTSDAAVPPSLAIEVICPATDKHIAKYTQQPRLTLLETRAAYESVTLPAVLATPPARTAWVDNILDGNAESDRVVARWPALEAGGSEDTADARTPFALLPDLKWDGVDPSRLYAVAIFGDPNLRSIRDIDTAERVEAVRSVHTACLVALERKYGAAPSTLRCFFHYHPSYWRLHIHYAAHGVPAADGVGKAHAVEDVLADDVGCGGGVAHRALTVVLAEGDPLVAGLRSAGCG